MLVTDQELARDKSLPLVAAVQRGWSRREFRNIRVCDNASWGQTYVFGDEFAAWMVIRAESWDSAWEVMLDESPAIDEDDLPKAFGLYILHHGSLHYLCSDHEHIGIPAHVAGPSVQHRVVSSHATHREAMDAGSECVREHELDLSEGYDYQPNAGEGTGIVCVGHYAWMNTLDEFNEMYHPDRHIVPVFSVSA